VQCSNGRRGRTDGHQVVPAAFTEQGQVCRGGRCLRAHHAPPRAPVHLEQLDPVRGCGTEQLVKTHIVQGEAIGDNDRKPEPTFIAKTRPGADHCRSDGAQRDWADPVQYSSTRLVMTNLMYAKCMCMYNKIRIFSVVFMSY
jgi:hypothetical protein